MAPGSILRTHPNATVYVDWESASLLSPALRGALKSKAQETISGQS